MGPDFGDIQLGKVVRILFDTYGAFGESRDLDSDGTYTVFADDGDETSSPNVLTLTRNFDGLTGVHLLAVDTGASGQNVFRRGHGYHVVKRSGTLDGLEHTQHLGSFSVEQKRDEHMAKYEVQVFDSLVYLPTAPQVVDLYNGQVIVLADGTGRGLCAEVLNSEPLGSGDMLLTVSPAFPSAAGDSTFAYIVADAPNPDE